jgi:hypothetical protein
VPWILAGPFSQDNAGKNQRILSAYDGITIEVFFPDELTIYDFERIGLWCVAARQDFGSITYDLSTVYVPLDVIPQIVDRVSWSTQTFVKGSMHTHPCNMSSYQFLVA